MTPLTLHIPTINDAQHDFDTLFQLWRQVNGDELDVTFDFSSCWFLRQNAVAFLGGLAYLIWHRGGEVRFAWHTLQEAVGRNLGKNGFRDHFGDPTPHGVGQSIPFRVDAQHQKDTLMIYLKQAWLGRGWVAVSHALRDRIVGQVWEIYANAFEHAESPIGLFSCGQHYRNMRRLKLTVVDFGVGIPSNVRQFFRNAGITVGIGADQAMRWAFRPGTTTKPIRVGRGLGLDLLKQFVTLNHGVLEVFSHDGHAIISSDQEAYTQRAAWFEGTLVNISLVCDDKYYFMRSEVPPDEPLF